MAIIFPYLTEFYATRNCNVYLFFTKVSHTFGSYYVSSTKIIVAIMILIHTK